MKPNRDLAVLHHSGACGHHAAPRTLVGNAFRQGFYWPTAVTDAIDLVRSCHGCQFYAKQTHLPAHALQMIPSGVGPRPRGPSLEGSRRAHPFAGGHRQVLQVDRGSTHHEHPVRAGCPLLHRHNLPVRDTQRHHHRQWHTVHQQRVNGLL